MAEIHCVAMASSPSDDAVERLLPLVYDELKKLAAGFFRRERPGHTLQPTALVHEAWLRMCDQNEFQWQSRAHFLAIAGRMMRRVLVDHARNCQSQARGGGWRRVELEDHISLTNSRQVEVLGVSEAIDKLKELDPVQAQLVELRFFSGLSFEETADYLGISSATAKRYWQSARAFLHREIEGAP